MGFASFAIASDIEADLVKIPSITPASLWNLPVISPSARRESA